MRPQFTSRWFAFGLASLTTSRPATNDEPTIITPTSLRRPKCHSRHSRHGRIATPRAEVSTAATRVTFQNLTRTWWKSYETFFFFVIHFDAKLTFEQTHLILLMNFLFIITLDVINAGFWHNLLKFKHNLCKFWFNLCKYGFNFASFRTGYISLGAIDSSLSII